MLFGYLRSETDDISAKTPIHTCQSHVRPRKIKASPGRRSTGPWSPGNNQSGLSVAAPALAWKSLQDLLTTTLHIPISPRSGIVNSMEYCGSGQEFAWLVLPVPDTRLPWTANVKTSSKILLRASVTGITFQNCKRPCLFVKTCSRANAADSQGKHSWHSGDAVCWP